MCEVTDARTISRSVYRDCSHRGVEGIDISGRNNRLFVHCCAGIVGSPVCFCEQLENLQCLSGGYVAETVKLDMVCVNRNGAGHDARVTAIAGDMKLR